jgi:2-dehydropantoate 2-reductase
VRFVVLGAGGIGGSLGGLLARAGHDVLLVARGPHHDAIAAHGLRVEMPDATFVSRAPVVSTPSCRDGDVVLLAVKTHDAEEALRGIPADIPVVCLTNGIAAERIAARSVRDVYGAYLFVPASHLVPGVVQLWASGPRGVIDIGAYPAGATPLAASIAGALQGVGFASEVRDDIMRYKRGKLLLNLGNAIEALCGANIDAPELEERLRAEAIACFAAAGLAYTIDENRMQITVEPIAGSTRQGGSTWQSLARGKRLEVDFLNGEIVALGRAHGVPTPVNEALQRIAADAVARGAAPGSMSLADLAAQLP